MIYGAAQAPKLSEMKHDRGLNLPRQTLMLHVEEVDRVEVVLLQVILVASIDF